MIPLLLSVAFGTGTALLYEGLTNPRAGSGETGRARWSRRLHEFLSRAGLHDVTPRELSLFSLGAGLAGGLLAHLFLGWAVVSLLVAGLGLLAPITYYVSRHEHRRAALETALVEAIAQLRDSIRAGLSIQEAMVTLTRGGPELLRPEFSTLVREMRLVGFEPAITAMRHRLTDPLFDIVAASLVLNDRLGGRNVSHVLDRLAHATQAQRRIHEELHAFQARNVLSARIVAAVPLVLLVTIRKVNPGYLAIFNEWGGQLLLSGCVASVAFGYASMLWITRLPGEQRVLQ